MRGFKAGLGVALLFGVLALAACGAPLPPDTEADAVASPLAPQGDSPLAAPTAAPVAATPEVAVDAGALPPAALEAQQQLASQLAVNLQEVTVTSVEAVDWSDSCLGAGGPAEICAAVITPGYRVMLRAQDKDYLIHTNADGSSSRIVDAPAP
jgi:hypothetical protein